MYSFDNLSSSLGSISSALALPVSRGRHGKLVDNFSHESDVTSLQDPFTSRPYKTPFYFYYCVPRKIPRGILFQLHVEYSPSSRLLVSALCGLRHRVEDYVSLQASFPGKSPIKVLLIWSKTGSVAQRWVPTAELHHQRVAEKDRGIDKCVRTRAGWRRTGSKCIHQHAKNAFCHAWSPQTKKANLSSRHRLQKRLQCNVAGSSLVRDEYVLYTRHWLTGAVLRQRKSPSGSKWRRTCNNHVWQRCSARKFHVPATVQYWRSAVDAHGDWAKSKNQSWFADLQKPGRQQSRRRPLLSV